MSIRDIIEAAVPCSVCADDLRSTCESLGQCKTRDAWRRAEREFALMEAERDALLVEHEAWDEWGNHSGDALAKEVLLGIAVEAHDNAERVIRG